MCQLRQPCASCETLPNGESLPSVLCYAESCVCLYTNSAEIIDFLVTRYFTGLLQRGIKLYEL